jgi:hypothetical protein
MSLLRAVVPAHARALENFVRRLRGGTSEERAILRNLQAEDRVPGPQCRGFQAALAASPRRSWATRFGEAVPMARLSLPVPTPRPATLAGPFWHHVPLRALQKYGYVSLARTTRGSRPQRRVRLAKPIGHPGGFWITDATSASGDDIRNRLGMCLCARGEVLYRVRIHLDPLESRPLFIPTAVDAGYYPSWQRPPAGHAHPWGLTRHLVTDTASERELLALPDAADSRWADLVGLVATDPPHDYLRVRGLT